MITVVAGGKKTKGWLLEGVSEYQKRLRKPFDVCWIFTDEVEKETVKLRKNHEFLIILDERGKNLSSPEFSSLVDRKMTEGQQIIIVIGGPYGFTDDFRAQADFVWSFSRLVFPHELMRLYLIEQIYRAQEIYKGSNYHHDG